MSNVLHIVLGDSAAGCLKVACNSHGLVGKVFGIRDDLSHGPLDDGLERLDYIRTCSGEESDYLLEYADAFEPWQILINLIKYDDPTAIVIWHGDNVSEATFLAMTCWHFKQLSTPLFRIVIHGYEDRPYVATYMPKELAALYPCRLTLTSSDRSNLCEDFERICQETGLLRRWESGRIIGVSPDRYDRFLEESCSTDWTLAARAVGKAMSRCDNHNMMSDLFFFYRLRILIDTGRIKTDGCHKRLRDAIIRLAKS